MVYPTQISSIPADLRTRATACPTCRICRATPGDIPAIREYFNKLGTGSRRLRLHISSSEVPESVIDIFRHADQQSRITWVLKDYCNSPSIVGESMLIIQPGRKVAELALSVIDSCRGLGFGKQLMTNLITTAIRLGVSRIFGEALRENSAFISLAISCGFKTERHPDDWTLVRLTLQLDAQEFNCFTICV